MKVRLFLFVMFCAIISSALLLFGNTYAKTSNKKGKANLNTITFSSFYKDVLRREEGWVYDYIKDRYSISIVLDTSELPDFINGISDAAKDDVYFSIAFDRSLEPSEAYGLCTNSGIGIFHDTGHRFGNGETIGINAALADMDGDKDLDVIVLNEGPDNRIWINDNGIFIPGQSFGNDDVEYFNLAAADVDGDNDIDVFTVDLDIIKLWLNNGSGILSDSGQTFNLEYVSALSAALGDLDGDKDVDLFVATDDINKIWFNENGVFSGDGQDVSESDLISYDAALGDLDGDTDLDVFVANDEFNEVFFNDGNGNFTPSREAIGSEFEESFDVALADIDGDNDLDAVVINTDSFDTYFNDGKGSFTGVSHNYEQAESLGLALGDLDNDNDVDIFVASSNDNAIWKNSGSGNFTKDSQKLGASFAFCAAIGDINGDDFPDVIFANEEGEEYEGSELLEIEFTLDEAERGEDDLKFNKLKIKEGKGGKAVYTEAEDIGENNEVWKRTLAVSLVWNAKKLKIKIIGTPTLDSEENIFDFSDELDQLDSEVGPELADKASIVIPPGNPRKTNCTVTFNNYIWQSTGNSLEYTGMIRKKLKYYKEEGDKYDINLGLWKVKGSGEMCRTMKEE